MGALCALPEGLGRQSSRCYVKLLVLGSTKAFVAFLASLDWRSQRGPTHYLDTLLDMPREAWGCGSTREVAAVYDLRL